jgi:hypothetical protein
VICTTTSFCGMTCFMQERRCQKLRDADKLRGCTFLGFVALQAHLGYSLNFMLYVPGTQYFQYPTNPSLLWQLRSPSI